MSSKVVVNLNGDTKENLLDGLVECMEALTKAKNLMRKNTPHGRNYATREDWSEDQLKWIRAIQSVHKAYTLAHEWAEDISDQ